MPRRPIPLVAGTYYHIFNRGNNRQAIFFERENYVFSLDRMREYLLEIIPDNDSSEAGQIAATTIVGYCRCRITFISWSARTMASCPAGCNGLRFRTRKRLTNAISVSASCFRNRFRRSRCRRRSTCCICHAICISIRCLLVWYSGRRTGLFRVIEIIWEYDKGHWCGRRWCYRSFRPDGAYQEFVEAYRSVDGKRISHLVLE